MSNNILDTGVDSKYINKSYFEENLWIPRNIKDEEFLNILDSFKSGIWSIINSIPQILPWVKSIKLPSLGKSKRVTKSKNIYILATQFWVVSTIWDKVNHVDIDEELDKELDKTLTFVEKVMLMKNWIPFNKPKLLCKNKDKSLRIENAIKDNDILEKLWITLSKDILIEISKLCKNNEYKFINLCLHKNIKCFTHEKDEYSTEFKEAYESWMKKLKILISFCKNADDFECLLNGINVIFEKDTEITEENLNKLTKICNTPKDLLSILSNDKLEWVLKTLTNF